LLRRIEDTWIGLRDRVVQVLSARSEQAAGVRSLSGSADQVVHAELIEPENVPDDVETVTAVAMPTSYESQVTLAAESLAPPVGNGATGRRDELWRQREAADDAVVTGRITNETHGRIVARIEAELSELGASS
jgi:hypothetical protein